MKQRKPKKNPLLITCLVIFVIAIIIIAALVIRGLTSQQSEDITIAPKVDITEYYYELPVYVCKGKDNTRSFATTSSSSCSEQLLYLPANSKDGRIYAISSDAKYIAYYDGEQTFLYTRNTGELAELSTPLLPIDSSSSYFVETADGTLGVAFFATITTSGCACSCGDNSGDTPNVTHYHYFYNLTDVDYEFVDGDDQLIIYSDGHSFATVYDSAGAVVDTYPVISE